MAEWYDNGMQVRDFAKALEDAEYADSDDVIKRPYKFASEFEKWRDNNYPQTDDPEWDAFVDALSENDQ